MQSAFIALTAIGLTVSTALAGGTDLIVVEVPLTVEATNPPANIPAGSPTPFGMAEVTIDSVAMSIAWDIDYQNLTGPIVAPGAHFHGPAVQGTNGGVQIFITTGDPPSPATGNLTGSASLTQTQLDDVLDDLWYINIHTEANQPGELRGQVIVPEPVTLGSLAAAGGLLLLRRRK